MKPCLLPPLSSSSIEYRTISRTPSPFIANCSLGFVRSTKLILRMVLFWLCSASVMCNTSPCRCVLDQPRKIIRTTRKGTRRNKQLYQPVNNNNLIIVTIQKLAFISIKIFSQKFPSLQELLKDSISPIPASITTRSVLS